MTSETIITLSVGFVVQAGIGVAGLIGRRGYDKRRDEENDRRINVVEDDVRYHGDRISHVEGHLSIAPPQRRAQRAGAR